MITMALMMPTASAGAYLTILIRWRRGGKSCCVVREVKAADYGYVGELVSMFVCLCCRDRFGKQSRCFEVFNALIEWSCGLGLWL